MRILRWLILSLLASLSILRAADRIETHRAGDEVVVQLPRLDLLRRASSVLKAEVRLRRADGQEKSLAIDLSDPAIRGTLVIDAAAFGKVAGLGVVVRAADGKTMLEQPLAQIPEVAVSSLVAAKSEHAAIQLASATTNAPRIALPDVAKLRSVRVDAAARTLAKSDITYPVLSRGDMPLRCASILVGRQTGAPTDPHAASLYVTYKKAIYVGEKLDRWQKFLVELPVQKSWADGKGDATVHLSREVKVHVTAQVKEKDWSGRQRHILGEGDDDLGQTLSATDDDGRIYFITENRVVRFDPNTKRFECSPPLGLQKLCPGGDKMKGSPGWLSGNMLMVCTRTRVFLIDILDYKTAPNPPGVDVPQRRIGGVFSVPQDWSDAAAFAADTRLHVGTWESATPTLYKASPVVGAAADERKLSMPIITEAGLLIVPAGKKGAGGAWRLDLDAKGNTTAFGEVTSLTDTVSKDGSTKFAPTREATVHGVSKTMVHLAGNIFGRHLVGPAGLDGFEIPRASIRQLLMSDGWDASMLLPPASRHAYRTYAGAPEGIVTVKYDFLDQLKASPEAHGALADSLSGGPSLGPVFLVTPVPGEADKAVAISDYSGYPLCLLDFSGLADKRSVMKSPLPAKSALATGLGAYDSAWVAQGDEQWLFITGYTGMTRIVFSKAGKARDTMTSDLFHTRMAAEAVDGHARGGLKQYDRIFPIVGGRVLDSGTGRPGRGGTPFTTGIEVFDLKDLRAPAASIPSRTAANLSRCCGALNTLQSRVVWDANDGRWRQEIFGSSRPSQVYVDELDAKDKSLVPPNMHEKVFLYEVSGQHGLCDLFAFALPLTAQGQSAMSQLALSPCHRFVLILTDDATLYTWSIAQKQFIDGIRLSHPTGEALTALGFRRPGEKIITAPDGSLFILSAPRQDDASVQFDRIDVSREGRLSVLPYLRIQGSNRADCEDLDNCVRCFMPDLKHADGSFDLIIGWDSKDRAQAKPSVRVITDFIPPVTPERK